MAAGHFPHSRKAKLALALWTTSQIALAVWIDRGQLAEAGRAVANVAPLVGQYAQLKLGGRI